jgi:hypothetical protein
MKKNVSWVVPHVAVTAGRAKFSFECLVCVLAFTKQFEAGSRHISEPRS